MEQNLQSILDGTYGAVCGALVYSFRARRRVQAARLDPLTGLDTRQGFESKVRRMLARKTVSTVLVMDLDGLKKVNDQNGHSAGDSMIIEAARQLRYWLPSDAVIARLGGDEFAAVWPGSWDHEVFHALASCITSSFGVVVAPKGSNYSAALARADATMYLAKRRGGGWGSGGRVQETAGPAPRRWARNKGRNAKKDGLGGLGYFDRP